MAVTRSVLLVGEMVHLNIHFPSPKPKLNLDSFERRFRSASMMTVTTGRSLLEAWKRWMFALLGGLRARTAWPWRWSCSRARRTPPPRRRPSSRPGRAGYPESAMAA